MPGLALDKCSLEARKEFENMAILRIGRLSVTPVTADEWATITRMAET